MALEDQLNKTEDSGLSASEYVEVVQAVIDNRDNIKNSVTSVSVNGGEKRQKDAEGNIDITIDIKNDYELAVQQGFVGTLDEWLASLHGKDGYTPQKNVDYFDGKNGADGSILYPSIRIDASGFAVVDVPDASEGTNFDIDGEGYLCVDFPDL